MSAAPSGMQCVSSASTTPRFKKCSNPNQQSNPTRRIKVSHAAKMCLMADPRPRLTSACVAWGLVTPDHPGPLQRKNRTRKFHGSLLHASLGTPFHRGHSRLHSIRLELPRCREKSPGRTAPSNHPTRRNDPKLTVPWRTPAKFHPSLKVWVYDRPIGCRRTVGPGARVDIMSTLSDTGPTPEPGGARKTALVRPIRHPTFLSFLESKARKADASAASGPWRR